MPHEHFRCDSKKKNRGRFRCPIWILFVFHLAAPDGDSTKYAKSIPFVFCPVKSPLFMRLSRLDVVVQGKLIRMWPQSDRVHFLRLFVINVGVEQFLGEYIAFEQEGVIFL